MNTRNHTLAIAPAIASASFCVAFPWNALGSPGGSQGPPGTLQDPLGSPGGNAQWVLEYLGDPWRSLGALEMPQDAHPRACLHPPKS